MENILMRFCRETKQYSKTKVATHLGITIQEYTALESGEKLITSEQSTLLGKLYRVNGNYFYQAALQLESLWIKADMVKVQAAEIVRLKDKLSANELTTGN